MAESIRERVIPVRGAKITVVNPLKSLRKEVGLTIDQAADRASVSRQFVIRAEQAVYTEPPDSLVSYYATRIELDCEATRSAYFNFQHLTRKANYGRLIEPWNFQPVGLGHPFKRWRTFSGIGSAAGICKLFCVHPATLNKFESHSEQCAVVPEQLVKALLESGYSAETLSKLEQAYSDYKRFRRAHVGVIVHGEQH